MNKLSCPKVRLIVQNRLCDRMLCDIDAGCCFLLPQHRMIIKTFVCGNECYRCLISFSTMILPVFQRGSLFIFRNAKINTRPHLEVTSQILYALDFTKYGTYTVLWWTNFEVDVAYSFDLLRTNRLVENLVVEIKKNQLVEK